MELRSRSKFWPKGVKRKIRFPSIPLFELLRNSARKHPKQTAIVFDGKKITFSELDVLSDIFASALDKMGVKKSDCVAILLPNCPQYVICYYGALKTGAFVTSVSPLAKSREIKSQLLNSEAKILVCPDALYPIVKEIQANTKIEHIIVTGVPDITRSELEYFEATFRNETDLELAKESEVNYLERLLVSHSNAPPNIEINPKEDLAVLQYTGGSVDMPKGVMLTHSNLLSNALMCAEWLQERETEDVVLAVLPFCHAYGMTTSMNAPIYLSDTIIMLSHPNLTKILSAIQEFRVTVLCGVPSLYASMVTHPEIDRFYLKSLKICISGTAPLSQKVQTQFMNKIEGILVEGYGLTEASPVTHSNPIDLSMQAAKVRSIGIPWPNTDAKIVDIETGEKTMPVGHIGELVIRGPQVMKGYWKMPEETRTAIRGEWLYTGDVGKMDEDGYFYITGRKKNILKYKGYSIYPEELEAVIDEHPAVKLSVVVGKSEPYAGEVPKALIVLKEGTTISKREIIEFVKKRVSTYKAIKEVEFRKELPVNVLGKVERKELLGKR